jgi:hypothetical protein
MTTAAIVFMLVSVSSVVGLVGWCYYRVLTAPPKGAGRDTDPLQEPASRVIDG